jgi:putative tryptophan/tyrosine transport system substrate-binding protein
MQSAQRGAQTLDATLAIYEVYDTASLDAAFVTLTKDRPDGLLVPGDPFLVSQRSRIAQFAIENKLPSVYTFREYIEAGGLVACTPNFDDLFRRAATYVDKILKGAKPGELPIEQSTKFRLVINFKTARTLGVILRPTLLHWRRDGVAARGTRAAGEKAAGDRRDVATFAWMEKSVFNLVLRPIRQLGINGR